jgi:predicted MFS family arabinose efflux permease
MDVGHSAGPMVTGLLVAAWGYGPAFTLGAVVLVVCAAIFVTLVRSEPDQKGGINYEVGNT